MLCYVFLLCYIHCCGRYHTIIIVVVVFVVVVVVVVVVVAMSGIFLFVCQMTRSYHQMIRYRVEKKSGNQS